jgi:hypothetical protein
MKWCRRFAERRECSDCATSGECSERPRPAGWRAEDESLTSAYAETVKARAIDRSAARTKRSRRTSERAHILDVETDASEGLLSDKPTLDDVESLRSLDFHAHEE